MCWIAGFVIGGDETSVFIKTSLHINNNNNLVIALKLAVRP
jgi:hypothetical protein